jgi:hypothetical protein
LAQAVQVGLVPLETEMDLRGLIQFSVQIQLLEVAAVAGRLALEEMAVLVAVAAVLL